MVRRFWVIIGLVLLYQVTSAQLFSEQVYKFSKVLQYIENYYVDTVKQDEVVEKAIVDMLEQLDPHSVYINKDDVKEMNEPLKGNFDGIGIQFNVLRDTILVINPLSGGPSEKVGIIAGDRIVKIEGEDVAGTGITTTQVRDKLMGPKGTKVNIAVKRSGIKKVLDFTITRDKIPIHSLDAAYRVKNDIGYIRLNRFSLTTMDEFGAAVQKLKAENVKHLILDLRSNGGGYMDVAVSLADEFLGNKKMIVYMQGRSIPKQESYATSEGKFEEGNVVVLIDEGSASASEIVTGALQDWDRGIIVGRRSFGKGLVQRPLNLPDGSMIRLTIARYYTPTGRLIQKPYDGDKKDYALDIFNRYTHGEMVYKDSIRLPDSLEFRTLKNKRKVYGGGGIMPDVFIPLDTASATGFYNNLIRKGILSQFVLSYMDKNRKELEKKYSSFEDFHSKFEVNDTLFDALKEFASGEGVKPTEEELEKSKNDISLLVKALVARDIWEMSEYFQIVNENDEAFVKALEILENWNKYMTEVLKN